MGQHAKLLERKGLYARLYAVNYGLSPNGEASTGDNGALVPAPAADN
jgi:hypothetical protein